MANELSRAELESGRGHPREHWDAWVPGFLGNRYAESGITLRRVEDYWHAVRAFLTARRVQAPRNLDYATAAGYVQWRVSTKLKGRKVRKNTAISELRFLKLLCREAVRQGYTNVNPCAEVETRLDPRKAKAEISEEDERKIEVVLNDAPQWMRDHWTVLICQGCRLREAEVPLDMIDEFRMEIAFRIKGGRTHRTTMHPALLPLLYRAREAGQKTLVKIESGNPSRDWVRLFEKAGLKLSVHSTRVTVITRLLRKGFSAARVCAYIGHTEMVNVIYRRLQPADVRVLALELGVGPGLLLRGNDARENAGTPPATAARFPASSDAGG